MTSAQQAGAPPPATANRRLALVIPTYCRADLLKIGLDVMVDGLVANDVALYVSDDSPDDATEILLRDYADRLPALHYRRNRPALRHDLNLVRSLLWPTEDHVWILGDAGMVKPGGFERVLAILDDQDFLFVNSHAHETPDVPKATGDAARRLVRELLWHQTLTGATVYSRRVLEWLRVTAPDGENHVPNFPHLSIILDFLAGHAATVGWVGWRSTRFSPKSSYWRNNALEVFVVDWASAVRRQTDVIGERQWKEVIRSHSEHMRLFSAEFLIELRRIGKLRPGFLRRHPEVWDAVHISAWKVAAISCLPASWSLRAFAVLRRLRRVAGPQ